MVYYVTVDGIDFEYNKTLDAAKTSALNAFKKFPAKEILIEVYDGKEPGGGGQLKQKLRLSGGKFTKV
jgi:hypothetical protein